MDLQRIARETATAAGYDFVEATRSAGGLLRVTIDVPWTPAQGEERRITVEDCETVTRQLQYVLEVEGIDYKRLEVSSPGIDRPLRHEQDFGRFAGRVVDITLKEPLGPAAAGTSLAANRKHFRGTLQRAEPAAGSPTATSLWQITWSDEPARKPGQRISKKRAPAPQSVLCFSLDELREARLAPIVDFRGRQPQAPQQDDTAPQT